MAKKKALVVYYSRSGTCKRVASYVAEALEGDVEEIEEAVPRTGVAGYARSLLEAVAKGVPSIGTTRDPRDYNLVVLGSPVWAGTMASPIRSYILSHPGQLRSAAFFAVMGGRGGEQALREMRLACGATDSPRCLLTQREVERDLFRNECVRFVRDIEAGIPASSGRGRGTAEVGRRDGGGLHARGSA